jgi:hypothetical protein
MYWTRRGLAEWLNDRLSDQIPTVIGIDHAFSFPRLYFECYGIKKNWDEFLDDFHEHWPTDEDSMYVEFVRDGLYGKGRERTGDRRWRRLTEEKAGGAKSVFHFDVPGSVAKSTHAGLPWLRYLRRKHGNAVHFWPFDGWTLNKGVSAVVEVYPSLWHDLYPSERRMPDQHDAYAVCRRLAEMDRGSELIGFLSPNLTKEERETAVYEGWIIGVK